MSEKEELHTNQKMRYRNHNFYAKNAKTYAQKENKSHLPKVIWEKICNFVAIFKE
jgi:hypothetical protein